MVMSTLQWTASRMRPQLRVGLRPPACSARPALYRQAAELHQARGQDRADEPSPPTKASKKKFRMQAPLVATPEARNIVRAVFRNAPFAPLMTTQKMYSHIHGTPQRLSVKVPSNAQQRKLLLEQLAVERASIPHPESAIRSLKYLKTVVLEDMADRGEVEKVTVRRVALDEDGRPSGIAKTCVGDLPMPPEVCEPELNTKKVAWMWRYKAAVEKLNQDEPERPIGAPPPDLFAIDPDTKIQFKETSLEELNVEPWQQPRRQPRQHATKEKSYGPR